MRKPQRIHVYPIKPDRSTTHVVDHDGMCWCKPQNKQVCSEAEWNWETNNYSCEPECWRCAGEAICEIYDPALNILVIHCEGQNICYSKDLPLSIINDAYDQESPAVPHRCPVCHGHGFVPDGFYGPISHVIHVISSEPTQCRSCDGEGIVWG